MSQNITGNHHIHGKKKIEFSYSDPGGTLEKIKQPKTPIYSQWRDSRFKEVKENALASEGKSSRPETIIAKIKTFQRIHLTDNDLADRFWSAITRGQNCGLHGLSTGSPPFPSLSSRVFSPFPQTESLVRGYAYVALNIIFERRRKGHMISIEEQGNCNT